MKTSDRLNERGHRRRGFTLLELIVAIAILAILAAAATPVATKALNSAARKATRSEIELLAAAAQEYFRDTGTLPASVSALESNPGVSGWSGPYFTGAVPDAATGTSAWAVDGWSRPYTFTSAATLTIRSAGADATPGTADDIAVVVDFNPVRRELTLHELATINQAITSYNAAFGLTAPLSTNWSTARSSLVSAGLLPNDLGYAADAWGDTYVVDPPSATPVVRVRSSNVGTSAGSS